MSRTFGRILNGLLGCIARLPLGVLYVFSDLIYLVVYYIVRYRVKVVRRNLAEAFPQKSKKELKKIEREFYRYLSETIVETVKLLHISDEELARRVTVENVDLVNETLKEGRSVALLIAHYGNWEWVQEACRNFIGSKFTAAIYHPLNDKTWDGIYLGIRSRWNFNMIPQKQSVKKLLNRENQPWVCGFLADIRPHYVANQPTVPFLNHHTGFVYGPEVISRKVGADLFFLEMRREKRGHYHVTFHKLEPENSVQEQADNPYPYTRSFWTKLERIITEKPSYWLWSHKRWKSDKLISAPPHPESR